MDNKHRVIIYKHTYRYIFHFCIGYYHTNPQPHIMSDCEEGDTVEIYRGVMDNPPVKVNECIYIGQDKEAFLVEAVARNTDGGFVYWVKEKNKKIVFDEYSKISKEKAETRVKEYIESIKEKNESEVKEEEIKKTIWKKLFKKEKNKK